MKSSEWTVLLLSDTIEVFNRCVHPDDVERITHERLDALATRQRIHRIDFRIQTPAGETRWIVSAARLIEANERTPKPPGRDRDGCDGAASGGGDAADQL